MTGLQVQPMTVGYAALLPPLLLLPLLLLTFAYASPFIVAVATVAGGLGVAAFLLTYTTEESSARMADTGPSPPPPLPPPLPRTPPRCFQLPLSSQISADYSGADNSPLRGVGDLPQRLFQVVREQANPLDLENWRYAEQKAEETSRVTHFAWTIPRWKGVQSVKELESAEFKDSLMDGVSWRCLLKREPGGQRMLVLVKAAQLDPVDFPEGRLFAEVSCVCEGHRKSTFGAFYPGVYEFALGLDAHRLRGSSGALTVSCTVTTFGSVRVHQLVQLPASCQTDGQGRYVNYHSAGIRWQIADWEQFAWETGLAIFSPLFNSASLPGYLWQIHLFPASDDPSSAGLVSAFVKLVDSMAAGAGPVEVDFELALQGEEDGGLFDTVCFARGGTHGFREIRRLGELRGRPLLVECALRVKLPLFT